MRIAHYVPLDLNFPGGLEKHVLSLAAALGRQGVQVDVFGKAPPAAANRSLLGAEAVGGESYYPLERFCASHYDILHTHSGFVNPSLLGMALQRRHRQRHVHTLHQSTLAYLLACKSWLNWRCYWCTFTEGMWSRYSDHVIAVSGQVRRRAMADFRIAPEKCRVIANGYTPHPAQSDGRQHLRRQLGIAPDELVVLFVGRGEDKVKGTAAIAESMERLHREFSHVRLLAVPGTGFNGAAWVSRTGHVVHHEMGHCYAAADIFVNASLNEGFPLTVVEAMAAGLPVVGAAVGGIPDLIRHGQNGLLLLPDRSDLTEQLRQLITNKPLRQRLGEQGQKSSHQFTWENIARQTVRVYESLL